MPKKISKKKKDKIRRKLKEGDVYREIAEAVGCSRATIGKYAKKWDLQHGKGIKLVKKKREKIKNFLKNTNKSYREISRILNCSPSTVRRYAKNLNMLHENTSLAEYSKKGGKGHQLSQKKRKQIKRLLKEREEDGKYIYSYSDIAEKVGCSRGTIYKYAKKWELGHGYRKTSIQRQSLPNLQYVPNFSSIESYNRMTEFKREKRKLLREMQKKENEVEELFEPLDIPLEEWMKQTEIIPSAFQREATLKMEQLEREFGQIDINEVLRDLYSEPEIFPKRWDSLKDLIKALFAREMSNKRRKISESLKKSYSK